MRKKIKQIKKSDKFIRETKEAKASLPSKVTVPVIDPEDFPERSSAAKSDFIVTAVESLLVKGITHPSRIANLLGVNLRTVNRSIPIAQKRWEISAGRTAQELYKGIRKLDVIEEEAWKLYANADNVRDKVACLRLAGDAVNTKLDRMGWTGREVHAHISAPKEADRGMTPQGVVSNLLAELKASHAGD